MKLEIINKILKGLKEETRSEHDKDCCELCSKKNGDYATIGRLKDEEGRDSDKYQIIAVEIQYHSMGSSGIFVCSRCHMYLHVFEYLCDESQADWQNEINYRNRGNKC